MIVAIDGPTASGKGTLARRLAEALDYAFLDTGLLYRAVGARLLATGSDPADETAAVRAAHTLSLDRTAVEKLDNKDLRSQAVAQAASVVARISAVRGALLGLQREFAANPPGGKAGVVLDGRDIGTVVCPDAEVKIFVTASVEERVHRRHKELLARGEASIYARVAQEMRERDERDSLRRTAPLRPAADAVVLDTTELDAEGAFQAAMEIIDSTRSRTLV